MKILLIILLALLVLSAAIVLYLLFFPIRMVVDSRQRTFLIGWNKWLCAVVSEDQNHWLAKVRIAFWNKQYPLTDLFIRKKKKKVSQKTHRQSKKSGMTVSRIQRMIGQIKIKEFKLLLDTDNYIWNAYLYPVVELINAKTKYKAHINYMGKTELQFIAESKVINMLKASIL